jgi:hypothetical protein
MKIQKFNENSFFKNCYVIIEHDNYDRYHGFDDENNACDFIINMLYSYFKKNENILKELDNIENNEEINYDMESIAEYYNDLADHYNFINKISTKEISIRYNFEFPDWIKERKTAKKYNL